MENYELQISRFIDNELPPEEQKELFRFLAEDNEAQQVLADYMEIRKETKLYYKEMDTDKKGAVLPLPLFAKPQRDVYKKLFYISAAASLILAFLLLFNQLKENPLEEKHIGLQSRFIKLQENYSDILARNIELVETNGKLNKEISLKQQRAQPVAEKIKPANKLRNKNDRFRIPAS